MKIDFEVESSREQGSHSGNITRPFCHVNWPAATIHRTAFKGHWRNIRRSVYEDYNIF